MPDFSSFQERLSDLEFLRQKMLSGDLVSVTGNATAGEIISYVPATGKTFFHISSEIFDASIVGGSGTYRVVIADVKNDVTTIDTMGGSFGQHYSYQATNYGGGGVSKGKSTIPSKLVGNSSKKFSVNILSNGSSAGTIYATITGWIEDT